MGLCKGQVGRHLLIGISQVGRCMEEVIFHYSLCLLPFLQVTPNECYFFHFCLRRLFLTSVYGKSP